MNNLIVSRKSLNNYAQLNILNELYQISNSPNKIYKLTYKKKKAKTIYLEKKSPNHYPIYMKFIKKNGNESKRLDNLNSFRNSSYKEYNFDNSYNKQRNSFYTDKREKGRLSYNPLDLNISNKIEYKNESKINKLKKMIESQKRKNEEENYRLRYNRFISISPSKSSKKENSKMENKNNSPIEEMNIEDNIKNNKEDNNDVDSNDNNDIDNNNNDYNKKHKIRYLLSKNYGGKRFIKKKYNNNKSPYSIISRLKKNNKNITKNNLINPDNNNFNNLKNYINNYSSKNINIANSPDTNLNKTDINRNQKLEKKFYNHNLLNLNNSPLVKGDIKSDPKDIINNIFLKNKNIEDKNNEIEIKLNDLIIIEERINDIIISLNTIKYIMDIKPINATVLFFLFYFNSSLKNKFPLFFKMKNRIIIKSAFNIIIFMILLIYHLSLNPSMFNKVLLLARKIFEILKINFYLIIRKIEIYYGEEFTQKNKLYFKIFDYYLIENDLYDLKEKEIIEIINKNCISITTHIENILNYYQAINNEYFLDFNEIYFSISKLDEQGINEYFYNNLYENKSEERIQKKNNKEDTIESKNYIDKDKENQYLDSIILSYKKNRKNSPFIKLKNKKKYTLILDLEDTLINVKIDNEGKIFCRPRPGLISFLNGIKPFYEIISFTKLSKEYSDIIIKEIEGNKKLFDYNMCRDHCSLVGRKFIKDISRIGRDLKKIIMVDDLEDNLRLYVNNGILICPFNGKNDGDDKVLFELKKLLILFFRLGYEDIRSAIKNNKKEIYNTITLGNINYI